MRGLVSGGQVESLGKFPKCTSFLEEVTSGKGALKDIIGRNLCKAYRLDHRREVMAGGHLLERP